jgi:hypothetical protein
MIPRKKETPMIRIVTTAGALVCFISATAFLSPISVSPALAQSCKNEAMSKNGKPLAGAAKTSAIKKCCETAAVSKDGKPLAGAAKDASVKKCVSESS